MSDETSVKLTISGDGRGAANAAKQVQTGLEGVTKAAEGTTKAAQGVDKAIQNIGLRGALKGVFAEVKEMNSGLTGSITLLNKIAQLSNLVSLQDMFTSAIKAGWGFNAMVEQSYIALSNMIGTEQGAAEMLDQLIDLSARTPLLFQNIAKGTQQLLAYQFEAEKIPGLIKAIGDANAGLGHGQLEFDRIILALGQIQAKSKVMAQEMRQLAEQGIPSWQILAEGFGVTTKEMMRMVEFGFVPGAKAIDLLVAGMEERFPDMMAKQALSWRGLMTTLQDFGNMTIGTILMPAFKNLEDQVAHLALQVLPNFAMSVREVGLVESVRQYAPEWAGFFASLEDGMKLVLDTFRNAGPLIGGVWKAWKGTMTELLTLLLQVTNTLLSMANTLLENVNPQLLMVTGSVIGFTLALKNLYKLMAAVTAMKSIRVAGVALSGMFDTLRIRTMYLGVAMQNLFRKEMLHATTRTAALRGVWGGLSGAFSVAHPILLGTAAALAGIGTAAYLTRRHNEKLRKEMAGTWELAKTAAEAAEYTWTTAANYSAGATLKVQEFKDANKDLISQLREIEDIESRRARVFQVLVAMQTRGVQAGELQEFADLLATQVNIGGLQLDKNLAQRSRSMQEYTNSITTDLQRLLRQSSDVQGGMDNMTQTSFAFEEQIQSLAASAKDLVDAGDFQRGMKAWELSLESVHKKFTGTALTNETGWINKQFMESLGLQDIHINPFITSMESYSDVLQAVGQNLYQIQDLNLRDTVWKGLMQLPEFWQSGGFGGEKQSSQAAKVMAANWTNTLHAMERYEASLASGASEAEASAGIVYDQSKSLDALKDTFESVFDPANAFNAVVSEGVEKAEKLGKAYVVTKQDITNWIEELKRRASEWSTVEDTIMKLASEGMNVDSIAGIMAEAGDLGPAVLAELAKEDPAERQALADAMALKYSLDLEAVYNAAKEQFDIHEQDMANLVDQAKDPATMLIEKLMGSPIKGKPVVIDNWLLQSKNYPTSEKWQFNLPTAGDASAITSTLQKYLSEADMGSSVNTALIAGHYTTGALSVLDQVQTTFTSNPLQLNVEYNLPPLPNIPGTTITPTSPTSSTPPRNVPKVADSGGWLMPGYSLMGNFTGKPEQIVGPQTAATVEALTKQVSMLVASAGNIGGGGTTINVVDSASLRKTQDAKRRMARV